MKHVIIKANQVDRNGDVYTEDALKGAMNNKIVPVLSNFDTRLPPIGKCKTNYNKSDNTLVGEITLQKNAHETYKALLKSEEYSIGCCYIVKSKTDKKINKIELLYTSIRPKDK